MTANQRSSSGESSRCESSKLDAAASRRCPPPRPNGRTRRRPREQCTTLELSPARPHPPAGSGRGEAGGRENGGGMQAFVRQRFGPPGVTGLIVSGRSKIGPDDVPARMHEAAMKSYDGHLVSRDPYIARLNGEPWRPQM